TTAILYATIKPHTSSQGDCNSDDCSSAPYGKSAPCAQAPGSASAPVPVSAALTGLQANTTYYFRIVATNPGGTSTGAGQSSSTQIGRASGRDEAAISLAQTAATLNATVTP